VTRIEPVTPDRLDDLADLFVTHVSTRGCWCMNFIGTYSEFRTGWLDGGNRVRFEALARASEEPMGLLAYDDEGLPIAWCATGPRSRYNRAIGPRATIMKGRDPSEDDDVWFVPCFFARVGCRRSGTTHELLNAAAELARNHGAKAIEGFPIAGNRRQTDEYLGRESLFEACGFECIAQPTPRRVVMRRQLTRAKRSKPKR
jgi:hypothetical protein